MKTQVSGNGAWAIDCLIEHKTEAYQKIDSCLFGQDSWQAWFNWEAETGNLNTHLQPQLRGSLDAGTVSN